MTLREIQSGHFVGARPGLIVETFCEPRAMKSRRDYELSARDAGCFALPADVKTEASVVSNFCCFNVRVADDLGAVAADMSLERRHECMAIDDAGRRRKKRCLAINRRLQRPRLCGRQRYQVRNAVFYRLLADNG